MEGHSPLARRGTIPLYDQFTVSHRLCGGIQ